MKIILEPDFTKYSLALIEDDKIICSSQESGLRPLWECLAKYRQSQRTFILFDKIIGLAAAKLVLYSGFISGIKTLVVSMPAKMFLDKNGIPIKTQNIVDNILTKDKQATCPGEIIALSTAGTDEFLKKIEGMLKK